MIENKILKKSNIFRQNCFGVSTFPPLLKAKNQNQNFEKHLKQKRFAIRRLNVPNFCYLKKKSG
jgi:hypothetical protein